MPLQFPVDRITIIRGLLLAELEVFDAETCILENK